MWVGEGTRRDCLYNRELCCHVLPLPECGSVSVSVRLVCAADALYRDVSLQVPPPWPEAKGESVRHLGPSTSVCAWTIQTVPGTGWTWVGAGAPSPPPAGLGAGLCSWLGG